MKDQYTYYEQIDHFLSGRMSADAQLRFEEQMKDDPALQKEVKLQEEVQGLVLDSELLALEAQIQHDLKYYSPSTNSSKKWWLWSLIVVVITGGTMFISSTFEENEIEPPIIHTDIVEQEPTINTETLVEAKVVEQGNHVEPEESLKATNSTHPKIYTEKNVKEEAEIELVRHQDKEESLQEENEHKNSTGQLDSIKEKEPSTFIETSNPTPITFTGQVETSKASYAESDGIIEIKGDVSGGTPPYTYGIENIEEQSSKVFEQLEVGHYQIYVVDATEEKHILATVDIQQDFCLKNFNATFTPAYEEEWKIPVAEELSGKYTIFNRSGIVYHASFEAESVPVWKGTNTSGVPLPAGYYRVRIKYDNQEECLVDVTILK